MLHAIKLLTHCMTNVATLTLLWRHEECGFTGTITAD